MTSTISCFWKGALESRTAYSEGMPDDWVFLTNHAHVLLCVASDPEMRLRDIADEVGVTERAAQRIVTDLVASGYLTKRLVGRRNCYHVNPDGPLRRVSHRHHTVGEVLELLGPRPNSASGETSKSSPRRADSSARATRPPSSPTAKAGKGASKGGRSRPA